MRGRVCQGEWRAQRKIQAGCPTGMLGSQACEAVFWVTSGSPRSWGLAGLNSEAGLNTQPHQGLSCHLGSWIQRCNDPDGQPTLRASDEPPDGQLCSKPTAPRCFHKGDCILSRPEGPPDAYPARVRPRAATLSTFPATRAASQADTTAPPPAFPQRGEKSPSCFLVPRALYCQVGSWDQWGGRREGRGASDMCPA